MINSARYRIPNRGNEDRTTSGSFLLKESAPRIRQVPKRIGILARCKGRGGQRRWRGAWPQRIIWVNGTHSGAALAFDESESEKGNKEPMDGSSHGQKVPRDGPGIEEVTGRTRLRWNYGQKLCERQEAGLRFIVASLRFLLPDRGCRLQRGKKPRNSLTGC